MIQPMIQPMIQVGDLVSWLGQDNFLGFVIGYGNPYRLQARDGFVEPSLAAREGSDNKHRVVEVVWLSDDANKQAHNYQSLANLKLVSKIKT